MEIIEATPEIKLHLENVEARKTEVLSDEAIDIFLEGGDIDETPVYRMLRKECVEEAVEGAKPDTAFSLLRRITAEVEKKRFVSLDVFI